jgi:hypothetical protein
MTEKERGGEGKEDQKKKKIFSSEAVKLVNVGVLTHLPLQAL